MSVSVDRNLWRIHSRIVFTAAAGQTKDRYSQPHRISFWRVPVLTDLGPDTTSYLVAPTVRYHVSSSLLAGQSNRVPH